MRDYRYLFSRREFLKGMAVAGLGATLPSFLVRSVHAAQQQGSILSGKDQRILVVVQLGGGNDGLNTVVPYADDLYYNLRQNIGIEKGKALRLDDHNGLHPALTPLRDLYDEGQLNIVQCVGYPNPDRSHFRSMEIWHTAVDSDRYSDKGWLGKYFDNACSGAPGEPSIGVNVGFEAPQAFAGEAGLGVSFDRPDQFRWMESKGLSNDHFVALNKLNNAPQDTISSLDFLRHTSVNAYKSSEEIIRAASRQRRPPEYPNNEFGSSLRTVATLISAGLPTRVYYVSQTGYDTHAQQPFRHDELLKTFGRGVKAFQQDLKQLGLQDQVVTLCFSEFGRRAKENASRGTDHGAAGPVFVIGSQTKGGVFGGQPDLKNLINGDVAHRVDFRSLYGEMLDGWLGGDSTKILGRQFDPVKVLRG